MKLGCSTFVIGGLLFWAGFGIGVAVNAPAARPHPEGTRVVAAARIPSVTATPLAVAPVLLPTPTPAPTQSPLSISDVSYRVTESNTVYWKLAYKLTLHNDGDQSLSADAQIQFLDAGGFEVDRARLYEIALDPRSEQTLTGSTLVPVAAAPSITSIAASAEMR